MRRIIIGGWFVLLSLVVATSAQAQGWLVSPPSDSRASQRPACTANNRNLMWLAEAASGGDDTIQICQRDASGSLAWATIATGGSLVVPSVLPLATTSDPSAIAKNAAGNVILKTDDDGSLRLGDSNKPTIADSPLSAAHGGVFAELTTALADPNANLTYTASSVGQAGNSLQVAYLDPGGNDAPLTFNASGNTLEISLATGPTGDITTTAQDIIDSFDADGLDIGTPANVGDGTGVVEAIGAQNLGGGLSSLNVTGMSWLDNGAITTDGNGILTANERVIGILGVRAGPVDPPGNQLVLEGTADGETPRLRVDANGTDTDVNLVIEAENAGTINLNSNVVVSGTVEATDFIGPAHVPVTGVGSLPTCNGGAEGSIRGVNDALLPAALAIVASGGAVHVPVYCDGTNWRVM